MLSFGREGWSAEEEEEEGVAVWGVESGMESGLLWE